MATIVHNQSIQESWAAFHMLLYDELPIGNLLGLACSSLHTKKKLKLAVFYVAYW
jgi:hypothetical protein